MEQMTINQWVKVIHENAVAHGWWDDPRRFGTVHMLVVCELAEAVEADREGLPMVYCGSTSKECEKAPAMDTVKIGESEYNTPCASCSLEHRKPEGVAVEVIDALIRLFDWCGYVGIDLEEMAHNMHGTTERGLNQWVDLAHKEIALNGRDCGVDGMEFGEAMLYIAEDISMANSCDRKKFPQDVANNFVFSAIERLLDWCAVNSVDVEAIMWEKHKYNITRPFRHGKTY